jgi:transcription elongation factor Elf1
MPYGKKRKKKNIGGDKYMIEEWLYCPVCGNKTRIKMRYDTELIKFPLFCPKCKKENLVNVKQFNISVITEPDAQTQSR